MNKFGGNIYEGIQPSGKAPTRRLGGFTVNPARDPIVRGKLAGYCHQAETLRHAQHLPGRVWRCVLSNELAHATGDVVGQLVAVIDDGTQPYQSGRAVVARRRRRLPGHAGAA